MEIEDRTVKILFFICLLLVALFVILTCIWKVVSLIARFQMECKVEELEQMLESDQGVVLSDKDARTLRRLSVLAGVARKNRQRKNKGTSGCVCAKTLRARLASLLAPSASAAAASNRCSHDESAERAPSPTEMTEHSKSTDCHRPPLNGHAANVHEVQPHLHPRPPPSPVQHQQHPRDVTECAIHGAGIRASNHRRCCHDHPPPSSSPLPPADISPAGSSSWSPGPSSPPPPPPPIWLHCASHAHLHHVHQCRCGATFPSLPSLAPLPRSKGYSCSVLPIKLQKAAPADSSEQGSSEQDSSDENNEEEDVTVREKCSKVQRHGSFSSSCFEGRTPNHAGLLRQVGNDCQWLDEKAASSQRLDESSTRPFRARPQHLLNINLTSGRSGSH